MRKFTQTMCLLAPRTPPGALPRSTPPSPSVLPRTFSLTPAFTTQGGCSNACKRILNKVRRERYGGEENKTEIHTERKTQTHTHAHTHIESSEFLFSRSL